jgi:cation diffusion facilitator family transporter
MAAAGRASPIRAILFAFAANLGIALAKFAAALYTGSASLLAEAIHSTADTGNQLLLLLGLRRAARPPDGEHPLGYGKDVYFWSFIVALLLFSLGGLFSIYEGIHTLDSEEPIEQVWVALLVLGVSIALETVSLRRCLREVNPLRAGRSLWRWVNESRNAELVVVLGEDVAALVGLAIAFFFVLLAAWTGDRHFDAYGSLAIGVLLVVVAVFVASRAKNLLIGRSADPRIDEVIETEIGADPAILWVYNVITIQIGPGIMLAAKVRMRDDLSIEQACEHINRLERAVKARIPEVRWSFIEPDVDD